MPMVYATYDRSLTEVPNFTKYIATICCRKKTQYLNRVTCCEGGKRTVGFGVAGFCVAGLCVVGLGVVVVVVLEIYTKHTVVCLSIGTPKNKTFSICPIWKINSLGIPYSRYITA